MKDPLGFRITAQGPGLGLAICKGIVAGHGGRIWAEIGEEQGSRFTFSLPTTEDTEYLNNIENLMNQGGST